MDDTIEKEVMEVPEISNFDDISPEICHNFLDIRKRVILVALHTWRDSDIG
jgi:hypothetical protein